MADSVQRRSALQFALDVTGGYTTVYHVVTYLQNLLHTLDHSAGFTRRARLDLLLFDEQRAWPVAAETVLGDASVAASQPHPTGASLRALYQALKALPDEQGGFHTFLLLTREMAPGWREEIPRLQAFVGSVTGLCCGSLAPREMAYLLSKAPGGTRIVDPLSTIQLQFDSIGKWLMDNFADRPALPDPDDIATRPTIRYDQLPHMMTPAPAVDPIPVPVDPPLPPIKPARWQVREPVDRSDPTDHLDARALGVSGTWHVMGASRRGKLHAHEGTWRDDAFALGAHHGWYFVAVADGAGSCRLSRVGARVATDTAIHRFVEEIDHRQGQLNGEEDARQILLNGLASAYDAVTAEAGRRQIPLRDLSATLLLLVFGHLDGQPFAATAQIGDGLIAAIESSEIQSLGQPQKGFYSGETVFLTNMRPEEWDKIIEVRTLARDPEMIMVMTDGIADDLVPLARQMPTLVQGVRGIIHTAHPEQALLDLIGYEKRDSADDRTLALLYR